MYINKAMHITKADVFWNYGATLLKIASSAILLPFILRMMPPEMVGIWSIFMTITVFATLLDFGFNPSFARNVTYIFSGVKSLKINGFETVEEKNFTTDYGLLKGVISAMRWFYSRAAIILFLFLITFGSYYIYILLYNYNGDHFEVFISWVILCLINSYNLYTLYYESLLRGRGLVKLSKQIAIFGQIIYLFIAVVLIIAGNGLVAIVSAQAVSVILVRWLSHHYFFTPEIKQKLNVVISKPRKEVLNSITPNAVKIGLTTLGSFMVQRSALVIGSLYLSLSDIASYGITMQIIAIIAGFGGIYTATYQPKIAQLRVSNNDLNIKTLYLKGQLVLFLTYMLGGFVLLVSGQFVLNIIDSKTQLISQTLMILALIISFLESNHSIAGGILLSKNEVPFFKASLFSGGVTVLLLIISFHYFSLGILTMIIAPGIAQAFYQNWKWPLEVKRELNITNEDIVRTLKIPIIYLHQ